MKDYPSVHI